MTLAEKKNIGSLFDGIASIYDRFNHLSSLGLDLWWRKVAVRSRAVPVTCWTLQWVRPTSP